MSYTIPASLRAILADADRVAPGRSHASDGTIGDTAHQAQGSSSDHNPDYKGIVHAVDVTNDPAHGMDTWHWAQIIARRIQAGVETRVKYLVSNDGDKDVIFNPAVSLTWRQNGARSQDHRSHLHTSILATASAENDTRPYFVGGAPPTTLTPEQLAILMRALEEADVEHGQAVDTVCAAGGRIITLSRGGELYGQASGGAAITVVGTGYWPGKDVARKIVLKPNCLIDPNAPLRGWVQDLDGALHGFAEAGQSPPARRGAAYFPGGRVLDFNESK